MSKRPTPKKKQDHGRSTRRYAAYVYRTINKLKKVMHASMQREKVKERALGAEAESQTSDKKVTKIAA